jgi:hypothetical protein
MTPFIEIALAIAGVFMACAVVNTVTHHMDSSAIKSQTSLGIQSLVAISTMSMTGSLAEEATEAHATATPKEILTSQTKTPPT